MIHKIANKTYNGHGWYRGYDPYNPLNLPHNTVRVRTNDGKVPSNRLGNATYETATLVPGTTDVYDVYKSGTNFVELLYLSKNVVEVLGANTIGITNMNGMFKYCKELTAVPLFDTRNVTDTSFMFLECNSLVSAPLFNTSNVTYIHYMFNNCTSLTSVPLFDTSKVSHMNYMLAGCTNVQSGALALYQQASSQTTPPWLHTAAFSNCGVNTETGSAELAQIPTSWGGTLA